MAKPTEDLDFFTYRGDSFAMKLQFFDTNKQPIDVTVFDIKMSVRDEYEDTDSIITKDRTAQVSNGIVTSADAQAGSYNLTQSNQIAVIIESDDTKVLRPDIYPFDVEFKKGTGIYTPIRGNLIVRKDMTINS